MGLVRHVLSPGMIILVLNAVGLPVGLAWDKHSQPPDQPQLPSDNPPLFTPLKLPSDAVLGVNQFLTYDYSSGQTSRIDTAASACAYYRAIGAIDQATDCTTGDPAAYVKPMTFETWKQAVKIGKYAVNGQKEDVAHFINQVDLNLTRDHHMISYGPNQLAGYVCNHAGPQPSAADTSGLFPTQQEVDVLIKTIRKKQTLIACVAMEYSAQVEYDPTLPAPSGTPFTRFWIFAPDGTLTPKVNLDKRGDKFVPGVCTACHGGDFAYEANDGTATSGRFAEGKAPMGDLHAHFLPFDMANFAFSSKLPPAVREEAIFDLNTNVFRTESTRPASLASQSITQLIEGWYGVGNVTPLNTAPMFNASFVAPAWRDNKGPNETAYTNAVSHSCRTCHAAMDNVAFELTGGPTTLIAESPSVVCGPAFLMPNSLVTFDRFWLSHQKPPGLPVGPDQLEALAGLIPTTAFTNGPGCPYLP